MEPRRKQCKDIPDEPILRLLAETWYYEAYGEQHVRRWKYFWDLNKLPCFAGCDERLIRAKLATLIRRRLADGCVCGCRGDFEITDKGRAYLEQLTPAT